MTLLVVPYDPVWPTAFDEERVRLLNAFEGVEARVEHIGSTAVPGLCAKPVLDLMLGVPSLDDVEARRAALEEIGYHYVSEYEEEMPERRYFRRPAERPRTHHLHCVVTGGPFWRRHLVFRDRLRSDPDTAAAYGALKRALAERHAGDRVAYTEAKRPFIEAVVAEGSTG